MIVASHGIIGSSIGQVDADYLAILNYATTQGYTLPSSSQRILQNQLLIDLKAAGVWNKLDTLAVFATDGNSDFALIDWKKLSQYTAVNSPTFSSNGGFAGNGTSSYVNSNFKGNLGVNFTLNSASRFFWVDNRVGTSWEGVDATSGNNSANNNSNTHIINSSNSAFTGDPVNFAVDDWHSICRVDGSNIALFTNTTRFDRVSAASGLPGSNQVIGKRASAFNATRFRIFGCGADLATENTAFYNAIDTYLTSL